MHVSAIEINCKATVYIRSMEREGRLPQAPTVGRRLLLQQKMLWLWVAVASSLAAEEDAAYSAATVARFVEGGACAAAFDPAETRCCASFRIDAADVAGGLKRRYGAVELGAIPKVASTTVREALLPSVAPRLPAAPAPRADDKLAGSARCPAPRETASTARFVLVRDPLARALSAYRELRRTRLGHWDRARAKRGLPSLTANARTFSTEQAMVTAFFEDVGGGVLAFDAHVWPQARCVAESGAAGYAVIGRLDRAAEAWTVFARTTGLIAAFPETRHNVGRPHHVRHRKGHQNKAHNVTALLDAGAWDAFCSFYHADYSCLGFEPPVECADRWRRQGD